VGFVAFPLPTAGSTATNESLGLVGVFCTLPTPTARLYLHQRVPRDSLVVCRRPLPAFAAHTACFEAHLDPQPRHHHHPFKAQTTVSRPRILFQINLLYFPHPAVPRFHVTCSLETYLIYSMCINEPVLPNIILWLSSLFFT
jgi:hypothetical protein